ncbi:MAG: CDP-alcohol phosphatidyltransferase family protein [Spirochaetaceae bacterium]|jgi:CDP-diacylglycerol--serine O-phosphatidyltransferase|nr:CDP-alcohol phosphatidyltransferase family protein [Spirochaetaceae bacterium]
MAKQREGTNKPRERTLNPPRRPRQKKERTTPETALRKQRKQLKYIAVLPTAVTLMNALCGFLSVVYASRGQGIFLEVVLFRKMGITFFTIAGYLIVFAMIADVLDGQVARWSGAASAFGGQLDSLSDAISFGVAPAFLMLKVTESRLRLETFMRVFYFPMSLWKTFPNENAQLAYLAGSWILFVAIFYMLCTVIRLARFNVENDTELSTHQNFTGLPSPAAAGIVVSLVIFQENFIPKIADRLPGFSSALTNVTSWLLPFAVLFAGILMVTRIRYTHIANRLLGKKKSFVTVLLILFIGFLAVWHIQLALLLGFWGFVLTGLIRSIYSEITRLLQARARR